MNPGVKRTLSAALVAVVSGCDGLAGGRFGRPAGDEPQPVLADPLPVQHVRAYPETVTGKFLPLADFEDSADGRRGYEQLAFFSVRPAGKGNLRFVVNETRTGAGALEATLRPGGRLAFALPGIHDFTGYRLLGLSLYSTAFRDDLQVTVTTPKASWRSHRALIGPGWNTVLFDIRGMRSVDGFDPTDVRTIDVQFADAAGPVSFNVDDVMVINNARTLSPTPAGMELRKDGLQYRLLSDGREEFRLAQDADGLWRLGPRQALLAAAPPGQADKVDVSRSDLLSARKVGQVAVLEMNTVRIRLASTWYFPSRAGEWVSLAVRRVRWEYTFYPDGRLVTRVELNNAGGRQIGSIRVAPASPAAWAGGAVARQLLIGEFLGPFGRWSYLCAAEGENRAIFERNYLDPGHLRPTLAGAGPPAAGDAEKDGFDESQGCYFIRAKAGHCRFTVVPPQGGLLNPVIRVQGGWQGPVIASSEGLAIRQVARAEDGSVIFMLPGLIDKPTAVEVSGKVPRLSGP